MESNQWHAIFSEKTERKLFSDIINEFQSSGWEVKSYQNPSEIKSELSKVLIRGLSQKSKSKIIIVKYKSNSGGEDKCYNEPIPVIVTSSGQSTIYTMNKHQLVSIYPDPINHRLTKIWTELVDCLETAA